MKAIVTGANGFVGSALVRKLVQQKIDVLAIDLSFNPSRLDTLDGVTQLELSIENIDKLNSICKTEKYDLFYHFAWVGSAGPLRGDLQIQTQNAIWTANCLKVASNIGCKRFICAGSIMEYEIINNVYQNNDSIVISNIYSAAKEYAHLISKPIANELGIELIWGFITNAYGVGEISPRFINTTIRKICNGDDLNFSSGTQFYDFVYIDDVANAFYLLGIKGKNNKGYMIGSGDAKPLKEFILEMCKVLKSEKNPIFGSIPSSGLGLSLDTFSIDEIVKDCGYHPTISFADGILKTKEWLEKKI